MKPNTLKEPPALLPSRNAARLAGVTSEALLAARDRGELNPVTYDRELWWSLEELRAWASDDAKAARKERRAEARRQAARARAPRRGSL